MNQQQRIVQWVGAETNEWGFRRTAFYNDFVVFELPKLPNFAEPRFRDLGEQVDDRKAEVARRQLQMLRQLHGLGPNCGITLRLRRDATHLRLFVIIRKSSTNISSSEETERLAHSVEQFFPKEYQLQRVHPNTNPDLWRYTVDLSWADIIDEQVKPEPIYTANTFPYFYSAMLWKPQGLNDMENVCRTMMRTAGDVAIDIVLVPTQIHAVEKTWVEASTRYLREEQNGARITDPSSGRILQRYDAKPGLRTPVENFEEWMKRYDQSPIFLYAFRVYGSTDPSTVAQSLSTSAARSQPQHLKINRSHPLYNQMIHAGKMCDIVPEIHNAWWESKENRPPYRAQRLHRLADIDEVASFWRFPIPIQASFPGFELDVGRTSTQQPKRQGTKLHLGQFADDPANTSSDTLFDIQGLTKHGLVVGVPGSGKTTTMFNLLHQLWSRATPPIPFIVLEPAKTEYRALKTMDAFRNDMLVFSLGDERISPFRLNPFEVPRGIPVESHISRLNACFVGAFNLPDPLPLLLDKAIRATYKAAGWLDSSVGGDPGLESPTLTELYHQAEIALQQTGYSGDMRSNINAALIQRLDSLRRGSKGRMLDTKHSVPFEQLMQRPVVLELDALNGDEKALLMMFILTLVYEYAKANRRSGSPLSHVLVVEEAHNLISRGYGGGNENRANPQEHAIRLFIQMLAEMRALGQGILIADQLPTAIAPEAMKQTNLKVLMRMTALDDRTEMGNTMDLEDEHLKAVTRFKSGQSLIYMEEWDRVRQVQTINFKENHQIEEPPDDNSLKQMMSSFEASHAELYMPFAECPLVCQQCNRAVRNHAEHFIEPLIAIGDRNFESRIVKNDPQWSTACSAARKIILSESARIYKQSHHLEAVFPVCVYVHLLNKAPETFDHCCKRNKECRCVDDNHESMLHYMSGLANEVESKIRS